MSNPNPNPWSERWMGLLAWIFGQSFMWISCGMVLVTTTASKHALLMRDTAGPEKIPCVRIAYTFVAPASINLRDTKYNRHTIRLILHIFFIFGIIPFKFLSHFSAAWQIVPQVSAMSSTKMATRSLTSPTRTMEATSFAFFLSLWIKANSTFNLWKSDVDKENETQRTLPFQSFNSGYEETWSSLSTHFVTISNRFSIHLCSSLLRGVDSNQMAGLYQSLYLYQSSIVMIVSWNNSTTSWCWGLMMSHAIKQVTSKWSPASVVYFRKSKG